MIDKRFLSRAVWSLVLIFSVSAASAQESIDKRARELVSKMTLEEKVYQLQTVGRNSVPRLGVPQIGYGECVRGVMSHYATVFPQSIAIGCSWDTALVEEMARVIALEARAAGMDQGFAPMLGLAQDARWGRVEECYGEDPYHVSRIGVAYVHGLQGRGKERLDKNHVSATIKHFAADGLPPSGQNGGAMEMSERMLRETHLLPFEYAVVEAKAAGVMPAHHALNGVPCHSNDWLLNELLRKEWGFDGTIISDYGDIEHLVYRPEVNSLRIVSTPLEASILALKCGIDAELGPGNWTSDRRVYSKMLCDAAQAGKVPMNLIDDAAFRIVRQKLRLGLDFSVKSNTSDKQSSDPLMQKGLDNELGDHWGRLVAQGFIVTNPAGKKADYESVVRNPQHDTLALRAAEKSIVLFKNKGNILPLDKNRIRKIAVVGELANIQNYGGYANLTPKFENTILDGIRREFSGAEVVYAPGCNLKNSSDSLLPQAVEVSRSADIIIAVVGTTRTTMGENLDRDNLNLQGGQEQLVRAVHATGKPVIVVLQCGGPVSISWINANVPAIIGGFYLGQSAGEAIANALVGKVNPSGRLSMTFPMNVGRVPAYYYKPVAARWKNYYNSRGPELYPFGYGLSYTEFKYSDLKVENPQIKADGTAKISVLVTNSGSREGEDVVQLYYQDEVCSVSRTAKQLCAFSRVSLKPGESRRVTMDVPMQRLAFFDQKSQSWIVESGVFNFMVGCSAEDIKLSAKVDVTDTKSFKTAVK